MKCKDLTQQTFVWAKCNSFQRIARICSINSQQSLKDWKHLTSRVYTPRLNWLNSENWTTNLHTLHTFHLNRVLNLLSVLQRPGVYNEVTKYVEQLSIMDTKFFSNFVQAELWAKKYRNAKKSIFPIFLYFDEFATRDPFISHAGAQKLGEMYGSFVFLPPHLVAKGENIFVSAVFYAKYLKEFGNEKMFGPSQADINNLQLECK